MIRSFKIRSCHRSICNAVLKISIFERIMATFSKPGRPKINVIFMRFFFAVFKDKSNRFHHFELDEDSCVDSVRNELADRIGCEPETMSFQYNGKPVPKGATFASISYRRGETIETDYHDKDAEEFGKKLEALKKRDISSECAEKVLQMAAGDLDYATKLCESDHIARSGMQARQ